MQTVTPKARNMDGSTYEQWWFKLSETISDLGRQAYLADTAAMFNCNYDPETAAREWLRGRLKSAP